MSWPWVSFGTKVRKTNKTELSHEDVINLIYAKQLLIFNRYYTKVFVSGVLIWDCN